MAWSGRKHPQFGYPVCGADSDKPNKWGVNFCCTRPMPNGKCRLHGGATPSGIASPNLVHGRYSKHLPARMLERYQEALADEKLLALNDEIALLDIRLTDLLTKIDTGESGESWKQAGEAYAELKVAMNKIDIKATQTAMTALERILTTSSSDYAAWTEIQFVLQQRRKLVDTERKRLMDMQQVITSEQAMTLISALSAILLEEVTDRHVLARIQTRVAGLLAQHARSTAHTE